MKSEVYNIDCLNYMKTIPDKFFDLAFPDPPYGINATRMQMGHSPNRNEKGQYPGESTAVKLRKGRLNQGSGKLKNRALNTMDCDWDFMPPGTEYFNELFRISKKQAIWGGELFSAPTYERYYMLEQKATMGKFFAVGNGVDKL